MKFSKQRELIYNYIMNSCEHLTADAIYADLKAEHPELSLGTVYRNLTQLSEIGKIKKLSLPHQVDRFDKNLEPHSHLICEVCGCVNDVHVPHTEQFLDDASKYTDALITSYQITFYGVCSKCRKDN